MVQLHHGVSCFVAERNASGIPTRRKVDLRKKWYMSCLERELTKWNSPFQNKHWSRARLVEQVTVNHLVLGSIPSAPVNEKRKDVIPIRMDAQSFDIHYEKK